MAVESEISTQIRAALAEHLKRDASQVRLDDELRKDLGLDSLSMIELLFRIEEAFDIEIPNEDLGDIRTVGEVIAYVERRISTKGAGPAPAATPRPAAPAPARPAAPAHVASARPTMAGRPVAKAVPAAKPSARPAAKTAAVKAAAKARPAATATSTEGATKKKGSRRT